MIDIKNTDGKYKADKSGRIFSFFKGKMREIKGSPNSWGYFTICIFYTDRKKRGTSVHRLIAETFVDNPNGNEQVNHINGDKSDNRADNLEWVSCKANVRHAIDNNLRVPCPAGEPKKIL